MPQGDGDGMTAFSGFGPQALPFFKALAFHQTKAWFDENRAIYDEQVKAPMGALIETLAEAFVREGIPLTGTPKGSIFRLNRDVRFSKEKSPYKTHAGAVMSRSGTKSEPGILYLHVSPEGCLTAAGFYMPEAEALGNLRRAIGRDPDGFARLEAALERSGLPLGRDGALTRTPRGFETLTGPAAAAVKLKSFVVRRPLPDALLSGPGLVEHVLAFARDARPLLDWGWSAVVDGRE